MDAEGRLKFIMGHTHCNEVVKNATGFMVAGQGMEGCGNFGIPVLDTTGDKAELSYFPLNDLGNRGSDQFGALLSCIKENGFSGCASLASKTGPWLSQAL